MEVSAWLRNLGLERYEPVFRDNEITAEVLPELTDADLRELGLPLGPRKLLLQAIASLRARSSTPDEAQAHAAPELTDQSRHEGQLTGLGQAERRQLTVMFVDLVGSTALSARLDPEDLRELMAVYHKCIAEVVGRFGGFIAKYMGDGVLVYFGWPQADEADAERAVRAGLATLEAVGQAAPSGERLSARIGVATGLTVVGDLLGTGAAQEQVVVGETPNLAARLQSLADPGCAVIDAETFRRVGGLFDCRELGAVDLKGLPGPVHGWQVLGEAVVQSRFEAMHPATLVPLIGREDELDFLVRRWRRAKEGEAQVVLISGEPGIGKSRLIAALEEYVAGEAHVKLKYFCSPHHRDSALQPIIARWETEAGFVRGEPADARLDKLETILLPLGVTQEEVALVAEMLGVPGGERYPPLALSPPRKKEQTFAALSRVLHERARHSPMLMFFEDAHWADPSSLELLDRTIGQLASLPVLLVVSFRPEFQAPWVGHAGVSPIVLSRLGPRQAAALASQVVVGQALPTGMLERIVAQTDGVPLFIEELTKTVLEGAGQPNAGASVLPVPSTLQASLMARLDRLPAAKQVAQVGAVIGREFGHELLTLVAGLPETTLARGLTDLVGAGLAFRRGTPPDATYSFKHALVQDAAYASLLRGTRQKLHARIADVLEERFPETRESQPELLAHHLTQAAHADRAIDYWRRAGERALRRSASLEATQHLRKGIELIQALPSGPERDRREMALLISLGPGIAALKGHAAPESLEVFSRAHELIASAGTVPERIMVLYGLWAVYFLRAEHGRARQWAEEALALAEQQGDGASQALANRLVSNSRWATGALVPARHHVERALAVAVEEPLSELRLGYSLEDRVAALAYSSWTLWPLGYPEQAARAAAEAEAYAGRLDHAVSTAFALLSTTRLSLFAGETGTAAEYASRVVAHCTEHGLALYAHWASFVLGWARFWLGERAAGLDTMRTALAGA